MGMIFFWGPTIVAYLTAFYMARSFALTFLGKPRDQHLYDNAHEAPMTMVFPQMVLTVLAVISLPFFIWMPLIEQTVGHPATKDAAATGMTALMEGTSVGHIWVQNIEEVEHGEHYIHLPLLFGAAWFFAIGLGIWMYKDGLEKAEKIARMPGISHIHHWVKNKFFFDAFYDIFAVGLGKVIAGIAGFVDKYIVDGIVNLTGFLTRVIATLTGKVDNKMVDGAVNGAADFAFNSGNLLRTSHAGRVRVYVMILFAAACLTTIAVVAVVLVTGAKH